MNKKIVLDALKKQVEDLQKKYTKMEETTVSKKRTQLHEKIKSELTQIADVTVHSVNFEGSSLEIFPTNSNSRWDRLQISVNTGYTNRYSDTYKYCELSSYSARLQSNDINQTERATLVTLGAIAKNFETISDKMISDWSVEYDAIVNDLNSLSNEMYKLNTEIRNMEYSIADDEKSDYKKVGFECQVKDRWNFDWNYDDDNAKVYSINKDKCYFNLSTGRSKWDYVNIWWFKVTKRNNYKTTVQYKSQHKDAETMTVEVSNKKFDDFISDVYRWQSINADDNNQKVQKRYDDAIATATAEAKVNLSKVKKAS